jgi:iron complex transport system substrate-binding protein
MFKPSRSSLLAALAVLSLGGLITSCSSDQSGAPPTASQTTYPKTIHAANGAVTIARRPTAIVSLSPTATEMLYAMGAGSQVKAVDKFSDYPAGTPMTSLDGNSPNVEAIASYRPDLAVISQETAGLDQQLKALGIPVLYLPAATDLNQEYQQFDQLGEATNHGAQASAEVAAIKSQIATIVRSTPKPAASLNTYYYELEQTYYSVTSSTFIGQVLGLLGLKSIADSAQGAAASGGYPQLNGEFILKSNPDYILLADTICCGQSAATVAARPGWSTLTAVKDGRVLGLNDDIASRWGPRIVVLLQDVSTEIKQHGASTSS